MADADDLLLALALAKLRELHEATTMSDIAWAFNIGVPCNLDPRLADAMFPDGVDENTTSNRPNDD